MIKFIINWFKMKWAIKKANMLHSLTRRQYYVLKWRGQLRVFSAIQIRNMKKRHLLNKEFNWLKLQELSIHKTP
jgi:hypothetical protein